MDFPGYGIGELSVGKPHDVMYRILDLLNGVMPQERPRYLMGGGLPAEHRGGHRQGRGAAVRE